MALGIFLSVLRAVGKSCIAALAGVLAVNAGLMGSEGVADVSRLTGKLLLPCFLVSSLSAQVTVQKLVAAWTLPVFALANLTLGLLIGKAVAAILGQRGERSSPVIVACCTFSNTAVLPLALIAPILASHPVFSGNSTVEAAQQLSVVYVSVFSIFNKVGIWTIGRVLIEDAPAHHGATQDDAVTAKTLENRKNSSQSLGAVVLKEPATISCALGLFIALTPARALFYGDGVLAFLMDGIHFLGGATLPMLLVVLGASLAKGPDISNVGADVVAAVAVGRLLVMPCVGSLAVFTVCRRFPSAFDPVMMLVLLLQTCMPSAESLVLLAQLRGGQVAKDMSALLFYQYAASPLTITVATSLALVFIASIYS